MRLSRDQESAFVLRLFGSAVGFESVTRTVTIEPYQNPANGIQEDKRLLFADFNGDGCNDLATLENQTTFDVERMSVYLSTCKGKFIEDPILGPWQANLPTYGTGANNPVLIPFSAELIPVGDFNGDGTVDVFDLLFLLGMWGPCEDPNDCAADINGSGTVDVFDLLMLLGELRRLNMNLESLSPDLNRLAAARVVGHGEEALGALRVGARNGDSADLDAGLGGLCRRVPGRRGNEQPERHAQQQAGCYLPPTAGRVIVHPGLLSEFVRRKQSRTRAHSLTLCVTQTID